MREWLNLAVRWFHVFAAIMWVGQTYYSPQAFAYTVSLTMVVIMLGQLPGGAARTLALRTRSPSGSTLGC